MLKPTRLTDGKTTRCDLSTSVVGGLRRHFATPLSACCALFFLLHGVAFSGDDADAGARPSGPRPLTSASTTRQPSNARLTVPVKSQDLASELAQLEFRFREAQTIGSERLDELTPQIAELVDAARRLATQTAVGSDERLDERAQELILQLVEFQRLISASSVFFKQLAKLDVASLDAKETRSFFSAFSRQRDLSTPQLLRTLRLRRIKPSLPASPHRSTRCKRSKVGTPSSKLAVRRSNVFASPPATLKKGSRLFRKFAIVKDFQKNLKYSNDAPPNGVSHR